MYTKHQMIRGLCAGLLIAATAQPALAFKPPQRTVAIASISVTPTTRTLKVGGTDAMVAIARDHSGHVIPGVSFTWSSSNHTAASINKSNGIASGLANGTTVITAQAQGMSGKAVVAVSVPHGVGGVAATGAPLASASITLVDSNGTVITTTTGNDGSYNLDTTGLKPPFLVSVDAGGGITFYSVSADADSSSVINVDPLTDLIIRGWYGVQGIDVAVAFAHPANDVPPTPATVQIISTVVTDVTALWLQKAGVDTANFSPISTQFAADGTGVDAVLAETDVDTGAGTVTITDGTTTQDSTVGYDTGAKSITIDTTTTGPAGTSSSSNSTVVATTTNAQTALNGITTTLNALTSTVNAKGAALKATDLLPYFDTNLLNEGLNETLFADSTATQFRGLTLAFQILDITSLDTANGLADVNFTATATQGDQSQTETAEFFFKRQDDGTWLFYGDQLPAKLGVQSEMRTSQGFITGDSGPDINVDIQPIKGAYTGITIDDGGLGIFTDTALTKDGTKVSIYTPDPAAPGTTVEVDSDEFFANSGVLVSLVPAGTPLTITMTPATASPQQYVVKTNAFTTESISITNLSDSSLAGATLGTPLHVVWTLPTTFAIAEVKLSVETFDGDQTQTTTDSCDDSGPILSVTDTSTDITIATTCAGKPVVQANLNLEVTGVNGERETVIYSFGDPPGSGDSGGSGVL